MVETSIGKKVERGWLINQGILHAVLLGAVILLGAFLRFYDIGGESYWLDEATMVRVAGSDFNTIAMQATQRGRPPVFVVMAHLWMNVFGSSEAATRSLSAVTSIGAIVALYILGRKLFNPEVALFAAFLMAVSEFQIFYAQNFRYYGLQVLLVILSFWCYFRALEKLSWRSFALYAFVTLLMFYTHTFGVFVVAAQGIYFLISWRKYKASWLPWFVSQVFLGLTMLPGMLMAFGLIHDSPDGDGQSPFDWIPHYPFWYPVVTFFKFVFPSEVRPNVMAFAVAAGVFALGTALFIVMRGKTRWLQGLRELPTDTRALLSRRDALLLVLCWLGGAIVLPLIVSNTLQPIYTHRYVISAAPALYLLLALGAVALRKLVPQIVVAAALIVAVTPGLHAYYVQDVKEPWRKVAAYIQSHPGNANTIVYAPGEKGSVEYTFKLYYQGPMPGCNFALEVDTPPEIAARVQECTAQSKQFWVIMRGSPERIAVFDSFFTRADAPWKIVDSQHYQEIEIYLLEKTG